MAIPCPNTQPHRPHLADNEDGMCPGRPELAAVVHVHAMIRGAIDRAGMHCRHWPVTPCRTCAVDEVARLSVFEPVLFPEETHQHHDEESRS